MHRVEFSNGVNKPGKAAGLGGNRVPGAADDGIVNEKSGYRDNAAANQSRCEK